MGVLPRNYHLAGSRHGTINAHECSELPDTYRFLNLFASAHHSSAYGKIDAHQNQDLEKETHRMASIESNIEEPVTKSALQKQD